MVKAPSRDYGITSHSYFFFSTLAILKLIHIGFSLENLVSIDPSTETLAEIVTISRTESDSPYLCVDLVFRNLNRFFLLSMPLSAFPFFNVLASFPLGRIPPAAIGVGMPFLHYLQLVTISISLLLRVFNKSGYDWGLGWLGL